MEWHQSLVKIGVYVDAANIYRNGGSRMQYDILREFACRDMGEPVRLNAYVTHDADRAPVGWRLPHRRVTLPLRIAGSWLQSNYQARALVR